ncbi:aminotransferase class III-fold pyridoxal phosphate-dependent enzyme [Chlamydiales bacterium]|nr:aminotransferase class III-fold pyridoxal phosphate-dependent enzyme [Chlamydiales bacterium]
MDNLASEELFMDPRIKEAKSLLLAAIDIAQSKLEGVKPPTPEREIEYQKILNAFEEVRGGALYYPYVGSGVGNGPLVELLDGSIKYDFICGIGPHYFGHSHSGIIEAGIDSAITNTIMQGHLQQNIEPLRLMEQLIEASGLDHCFLTSSGAMATENALKLAFHHKPGTNRVLAFDHCFMGRTLSLSQITDKPAYKKGLPANLNVNYVPFYDSTKGAESIEISNKILRQHLDRYPGQISAMCLELIQGEGGFNVGTHQFFKSIMSTLKEHEVKIIVDEVQTFGRTENLFAFKHFELDHFVDIVCIGKLSQVCATLFKSQLKPSPGLLSQTFTASSSAINAAIYVLNDLIHGNYFGDKGTIAKVHNECLTHFKVLEEKYPGLIRGPYGIGAMIAFIPFDGEPQQTLHFAKELFKAGLITFVAGSNPMKIRMLIPVPALREGDLENVFAIIDQTLNSAKKNLW